MKASIYGQRVSEENIHYVAALLDKLESEQIAYSIYKGFARQLSEFDAARFGNVPTWSGYDDLAQSKPDYLITTGGDGTILSAITHVRELGIPIVGINLGRLGFLASIEKGRIAEAIDMLMHNRYLVEERQMLYLESQPEIFGEIKYALNDFTIHKRDTSSMITIHTYVNGDFLNSYWADGLIVATPTGSTGYSLSCGGPIIFPNSGNIAVTPVAPHNLNVRPIVLSDNSVISFEIEGRSANFLCTLDSRVETITSSHQLAIRKNDFGTRLVRLHNSSFPKTIHEKLSWGKDQRN